MPLFFYLLFLHSHQYLIKSVNVLYSSTFLPILRLPQSFILGLSLALLVSCSSETSRTTHLGNHKNAKAIQSDLEAKQTMEERFAGNFTQVKGKDGNMKIESKKRSSFENSSYEPGGTDLEKKAFGTKAFDKKNYDGVDKQFETAQWKDSKSLKDVKLDTPEFIKNTKGIERKNWDEATKDYDNASKQVADQGKKWDGLEGKKQEHLMNENVADKRAHSPQAEIMSPQEYQMKSIEEVRAMMGRDQ